jgi:hexosaminidase
MKKNLFLLAFILSTMNLMAQDISIIPQPVEMQRQTGVFALKSTMAIAVKNNDAASERVGSFFANKIARATGMLLPTSWGIKNKEREINFFINTTPNPVIGNEGYTLDVTPKKVILTANTEGGLFYGVQTLLQLLPKDIGNQSLTSAKWEIPCVKIVDYPRFPWRGLMLDVSRHFFPKEDVKRYIDNMAKFKYNTFHWHLTDDQGWRIEIKSLPKLTEVGAFRVPRFGKWGQLDASKEGEKATDGGFYTQEDIKEIVAYAAERHITVLPEIDVPGHSMAAIAAYPEMCCTKDPKITVSPGHKFSEWYGNGKFKMLIDNSLDPSNEDVYTFLDKIFGEVATLFPHPYIHIGGDECYHGYWAKDSNCVALMQKEGLKNTEELQSYFIKRLEKILKKHGKKLIGWDEILEGGLAPEASVMSWRGYEGGIAAAKQGHYVVMSPNDYVYIDLLQGEKAAEPDATDYKKVTLRKAYDFEPVPDSIDAKYILGGQANLWTEKVPTMRHAEYMTYPRAWALSDVYWSPKGSKNWDNFVVRMEKQMERADVADMNYARSAFDAVVKTTLKDGKLMADITTEIAGLDIYYTLNETTPDKWTPQYKTPFEVPEGPVSLKVITYRGGKPVGKMVVLPRETLLKRATK